MSDETKDRIASDAGLDARTSTHNEVPSVMPDETGHFGQFGGRFVSETLMAALEDLESLYLRLKDNGDFKAELAADLKDYVGRESPLYFARRLTEEVGGARILLKREDLNHTGAHKVNNCIGQAMLAKHMGKTRIIAETGAGQHGVATATVAARLGLECHVYMGTEDIQRQSTNVYRMKLLGANVIPVDSGSKTLKDALSEALRDWVTNVDDTYYIIGTVAGPHPYPMLVRDFQSVIGEETRRQCISNYDRLPDILIACVGGGSNAMGLFYPFINDHSVRMIGVEPAGEGLDTGRHAAPLNRGTVGVLHGNRTLLMQDAQGLISDTHSVSAGLDYPGVGPEHAWLKESGRAEYVAVDDTDALAACRSLNQLEGILPALESSHAVAYAMELAAGMSPEEIVIINLSGRGDKDIPTLARIDGISLN